jgi:type II secretory pathway pseudopilin PulG
MALIICYLIACVQIIGVAFNLWGFDPRLLANLSLNSSSFFIALFVLIQVFGLIGALLIFARLRAGFVLSILHHALLMPAVLIASSRFVLLADDLLNASLFYLSKPTGSGWAFYWSLGWETVFKQVTRGVPRGSVFVGVNLFALACVLVLWAVMRQMAAAKAREAEEAEMTRRREQRARRRSPEPRAPRPYPQDEYPQPYPEDDYPQHDYPQDDDSRHPYPRYPQAQHDYSRQAQPPQRMSPQPRPPTPQQRLQPQPGVRMPPRMRPRES